MKVSMKKNDGVSPVIGTILLVAITVVLVAIISAVVMGMTNDIGSSKIVGVQVTESQTADTLLVTITGGANAGELTNLSVYAGSTPLTCAEANATTHVLKPVVGKPYTFTYTGATTGQYTISVVGQFTDGTNQSLYSSKVGIV